MRKRPVVVVSSSKDGIVEAKCDSCGENVALSANDSYCPKCSEAIELTQGTQLSASVSKLEASLKCGSCDQILYTNAADAQIAANSSFCPVCGSADVEEANPSDLEEDYDEDMDVEEEVEEKLASSTLDLEAAFIASPESWMFFDNGTPLFKLEKSKLDASCHAFFASDRFIHAFQARASETSLARAIKEFNGEILKADALTTDQVEDLALEKFQSSVLPKFLDCIAIAIEGAVKGVFPEVGNDLKAGFYDEMVARGMTKGKAIEAIEAAFSGSGKQVFSSVIAKAMELFNKPEPVQNEIKAMLQKSGTVASFTGEDFEQQELQARLRDGNLPIVGQTPITVMASMRSGSVSHLRTKLSLRQKV